MLPIPAKAQRSRGRISGTGSDTSVRVAAQFFLIWFNAFLVKAWYLSREIH